MPQTARLLQQSFPNTGKFEDSLSVTASTLNDQIAKIVDKSKSIHFGGEDNLTATTIIEEPELSAAVESNAISKNSIYRLSDHTYRRKEKELQWWLGRVVGVSEATFTAKLEDLAGRVNIVEFEKLIVLEHQQNSIKKDAQFTYKGC
jgi:hypothetical protein